MPKKLIKIVIIFSGIVFIAAVICMIWLIRVCGVFFKEYTKSNQQNAPVMAEEKEEKFVPDECISAYIGEKGRCNYSDMEEFKRKYPNVIFVW